MKTATRLAIAALLVIGIVATMTACSSDGYYTGTSTVYVGHGYGGYGPGWGYGWGGGYYAPPPVIIGPPVGIPHTPVAVPY